MCLCPALQRAEQARAEAAAEAQAAAEGTDALLFVDDLDWLDKEFAQRLVEVGSPFFLQMLNPARKAGDHSQLSSVQLLLGAQQRTGLGSESLPE